MTLQLGEHWHNLQSFLNDERRDADGHTRGDPDFDPGTILLPPAPELSVGGRPLTAALTRWWEFKRQNFETLAFLKVVL